MANPMYQLLGIPDPAPGAGYDQYFANVPDTSWIQARGLMPQTQTGNMGYPQQGVGYQPGMPQQYGGQQMDPTQDPYALAQKAYEDSHIKAIQALDPTKFSHPQDVENYILNQQDPNLGQNPRVMAAAKYAQAVSKQFQQYAQRYPKAASIYNSEIKSGKTPDEALDTLRGNVADAEQDYKASLKASEHGLDPEKYRNKGGRIDELAMNGDIFRQTQQGKQTRIPMGKDDLSAMKEGMQAIKDAHDLDTSGPDMIAKKQALIDSKKAKDWPEADAILKKQAVEDATGDFKTLLHTYHGANYAMSPLYFQAAGEPIPEYMSTGRGKVQMTPGGQQGSAPQAPSQTAPDAPQSLPPAQAPMSYAQRIIQQKQAVQQAMTDQAQAPVNQAFTKAKAELENKLRQSGLSQQDLTEAYRSIYNGDEGIPTEPVADPTSETGFADQLPTTPTSQFILKKANIQPDETNFNHPMENRPVTQAEVLKDLAKDRLNQLGEIVSPQAVRRAAQGVPNKYVRNAAGQMVIAP